MNELENFNVAELMSLYVCSSCGSKEFNRATCAYCGNKNEKLEQENRNLNSFIKYLFDRIKEFFRNILLKGNENSKDLATQEVKDYYKYGDFGQDDIIDIARCQKTAIRAVWKNGEEVV